MQKRVIFGSGEAKCACCKVNVYSQEGRRECERSAGGYGYVETREGQTVVRGARQNEWLGIAKRNDSKARSQALFWGGLKGLTRRSEVADFQASRLKTRRGEEEETTRRRAREKKHERASGHEGARPGGDKRMSTDSGDETSRDTASLR